MGWGDPPGQPSPSIEKAIEDASLYFKETRGRWPNFVRVSPSCAEELGDRLNGLLVIGDPKAGKAYRLLMGWSEEAEL